MLRITNELRLLQMNLHRSRERTHGVLSDPDTKDYTMILLQEPFWSDYMKESPSHQSWTRYEPTNRDKDPRAVTYVNKAYVTPAQITQIELPFTDVVALRIHSRNSQEPPALIINVYNPGDKAIIRELHEELQKIHFDSDALVILAGDFNCHHPLWNPENYPRHDDTADHLVELATDLGLTLLIPPGTVTYPNAQTAIDLVWGNHSAEARLLRCQIAEQNDQGSDHLPVETCLSSMENPVPETPRLDFSRTDWAKFDELLKAKLPPPPPDNGAHKVN